MNENFSCEAIENAFKQIEEFIRQQREEKEKTLAEIIKKYDFIVGSKECKFKLMEALPEGANIICSPYFEDPTIIYAIKKFDILDYLFAEPQERSDKTNNVKPFLKVKDLKKLLSDIPDDWYITVTSSETKRHITHITSVGILESESEFPNKCLSFCCDDHSISEETGYTSEVLFDYFHQKQCEEANDESML